MRVSLKFTVIILILSLAMSGFALSTTGSASANGPKRYVLLSTNNALPDHLEALVESAGGKVVSRVDEIGMAVVESAEANFLEAAGILPGIEGIAEDRAVLISPPFDGSALEGLEGEEGLSVEGTAIGSGRFFFAQWSLRAMGADNAFAAGFKGDARVKVAVIDTGIDYRHQDLSGMVDMVNSKSFFDETWFGMPWPAAAPKWVDINGHGTHVAGLIGGKGVNVTGVAPGITLVAIKVAGRGGFANLSTIAQAIVYAANLGVDVINMSFGDDLTKSELKADHLKQTLWRAVNLAHARGIFMASSAGNNAINWDDKDHKKLTKVPAQLNHVVGVSATGPFMGWGFDNLAVVQTAGGPVAYTDYGKSIVTLAAPGGSQTTFRLPNGMPGDWVISTCALVLTGCSGGRAGLFSVGTSMASAHIAGAAALIDSAYGGALTGDQILAILKRGAEDFGKPGFDELYGHGRINVYRSLTLK